jgi:hypothetical protein
MGAYPSKLKRPCCVVQGTLQRVCTEQRDDEGTHGTARMYAAAVMADFCHGPVVVNRKFAGEL